MLKNRLIERLKSTEDQKIKVVWDAGGDSTIVNFYQGEKSLPYYEDKVLDDLRDYLINEFNLPNAGEYYNEGGGEISIVEDNRVLFVYDEYAYGDDYDQETEGGDEIEAFSIPGIPSIQKLLTQLNLTQLNFYGSTTFLAEEKDEFNVYSRTLDYNKSKTKIDDIQEHIKKNILTKFSPPFEAMEIGYSGIIKEKEIIIEEIYKIKYFIDKDNKQKKIFLFEKGGDSWLKKIFG